MSFVIAAPDLLTDAAGALSDLNSTISQANVAAASPTTAVLAAGADEVSAAIAALFSGHGRAFQSLSTEASAPIFWVSSCTSSSPCQPQPSITLQAVG